jgi:hypothetical protein
MPTGTAMVVIAVLYFPIDRDHLQKTNVEENASQLRRRQCRNDQARGWARVARRVKNERG